VLHGQVAWWAGWALLRASAGRRAFTLPPSGPAAAVHLTTVVRLPAEITAALAPALDRLRAVGPLHHYYPPAAMHLTVQNLDPLGVNGDHISGLGVGRDTTTMPGVDGDPAPLLAEVRGLVGAHPPFQVAVRGLGAAPATVFALAFPDDPTLRSLRAELAGLLAGKRLGRVPSGTERRRLGRGSGSRRALGHANLVRFSGPVTAAFLSELARLRRQDFGCFAVGEVELVRTDRFLSPEGTTVLERIRLTGRSD
jgi:2'-5' RNA ligase